MFEEMTNGPVFFCKNLRLRAYFTNEYILCLFTRGIIIDLKGCPRFNCHEQDCA